jgi:UDP-glucose 4-epimerase
MDSLREIYRDKKILITGGLGFLGSNLAHKLVEFNSEVTLLDALLPLYGGNRFNVDDIENKVKVILGDIRDFRLIEKLVEKQDIIFNLAAQVSYIDSINMPLEDLDINCKGHLIVLDACRHRNPGVRLIFPSSRMVIGKVKYDPVDENHPTEPLSIYGIHKLAAEKYYMAYHKTYGLNTVILRLTNPYGIRQQMKHDKYSLVGWFLRMAMEGKTIKVFGGGNQLRDYVYVDDVTEAFLNAGISRNGSGQIYNIGLGKSYKFLGMVEKVLSIIGRGKIEDVPWPDNYENIETGDFQLSIEKARKAWGWNPGTDLGEGIEKMRIFYEKYQTHYW